jgi:hypothetical protein
VRKSLGAGEVLDMGRRNQEQDQDWGHCGAGAHRSGGARQPREEQVQLCIQHRLVRVHPPKCPPTEEEETDAKSVPTSSSCAKVIRLQSQAHRVGLRW